MQTSQPEIRSQVETRRTFAIIAHPDAGKTTLTEKLLLLGGAIRMAGEVKGRKAKKFATSDWMQIEKERGISITSSVLQFDYKGYHVNILDTPGHQDFSEDTYRTLMAADSAVMLIDAAKGVEPQTVKLFQVCRQRGIPIFTFINKMDRYGKEPLTLLEELENVLGIRSCPMNWPIGMGSEFKGIFHRQNPCVELYDLNGEAEKFPVSQQGLQDPELAALMGTALHQQLTDEIDLLDIAGDPFRLDQIMSGQLTPVFFGSAINKFGVQSFLDQFLALAPPPQPHKSNIGFIDPYQGDFSGFIFKIQANMNPAHRDRIAFLRVCSGKFVRGMSVHHVREKRRLKLTQPQQFFAQDRDIIETAYAGDIIGLHDPGIFHIGDSLTGGGPLLFQPLPQFPPEHFARLENMNAIKYKQFQKGIQELMEEGCVQIFRRQNQQEDLILGVVGELQFEVFSYRLQAEYRAQIKLQRLPYQLARWLSVEAKFDVQQLNNLSSTVVYDQYNRLVLLCESQLSLHWLKEKYPQVLFLEQPVEMIEYEGITAVSTV